MKKNDLSDLPIVIFQPFSINSSEAQCDACPAGISSDLAYKAEPYQGNYISPVLNLINLNNGFNVAYASHIHLNPLVLNDSAITLLEDFKNPKYLDYQTLSDKDLKKFLELNLIRPAESSTQELIESSDTLTAQFCLTSTCNLSCDYCFMPHNSDEMSFETGYRSIDAAFRSAIIHNFRIVKLKYSGGEPLRCFSKILQFHKYASALAKQYNIELQGSVLSNGTLLTPDIIEKIKSLNLRLMISLDGLKKDHDCQRHFADGSGSFDKVVRSIGLALSEDLIPDISITVSSRNISGLPELMQWVLEKDLPFSLNFYRENDFSEMHKDLKLEEERIINGLLAAYKVIESHLPRRSLLASLADRANLAIPHLRPCSVGHSYMVFDTNGNISKCQMQMNPAITDIHSADPLKLVREDRTGIRNISVEDKEECRECQWKHWCAGGCPLEAFRVTGKYDAKSPNCNIYKAIFPEILRLEGLRMLHYHQM